MSPELKMTLQSKSMRGRFYQPGGSHPYEHKLRLKSASSTQIPGFGAERSLTVTNFQIAPRATFEMERPQTGGSPRLVVINTSFRAPYQDRNINNRRRVPTFPKLATESATPRNMSRLTNASYTSVNRQHSGGSNQKREIGSASNRLSATLSRTNREVSAQSERRSTSARAQLTKRQSNTFAQYAKYNDYVNSTKAREKASENNITSNINDLSALVPRPVQSGPELLSNEKHMWISDWVESTSTALRLNHFVEEDWPPGYKTLSVIQEH